MTTMFKEIWKTKFASHCGYLDLDIYDPETGECVNGVSGKSAPFNHFLQIEIQCAPARPGEGRSLEVTAVCYPGGDIEHKQFLYSAVGEASDECCRLLDALDHDVNKAAFAGPKVQFEG